MIIVIVKKELLGAMFAIVVTDHQVHWLANALFDSSRELDLLLGI